MDKEARVWLAVKRGNRTQREIADEIQRHGVECSRAWYSLIEIGLRDPSPEVAAVLAEIYGVSMSFVFFGQGGFKNKQTSDEQAAAAEV